MLVDEVQFRYFPRFSRGGNGSAEKVEERMSWNVGVNEELDAALRGGGGIISVIGRYSRSGADETSHWSLMGLGGSPEQLV